MTAHDSGLGAVKRVATRPALFSCGVVLATLCVALLTTAALGALSPEVEPGLPDAGDLVRVAIPIFQGVRDVAAALTVGMLVVVTTCIPGQRDVQSGKRDGIKGVAARGAAIAQLAAASWAASSLVLVALVFADASGTPVDARGFWSAAWAFSTSYELGQTQLVITAWAAAVAVACAISRTRSGLGFATVLALVGLWPIAQTGHAAGTLAHNDAVTLQMAHWAGVAVWLGGLASLVVLARPLGSSLVVAARRWSTLAAWSAALVATSGLVGAWIRVRELDGFASGYGLVLAAKLTLLVLLVGAGWWQRRRLLQQLEVGRPGAFIRLAGLECFVLASAAGLGVALSRTAPPPPTGATEPLTAAESMLGRALPPPLDAGRWLSQWDVDLTWLPLAVLALAWYVRSHIVLRRRGDTWPVLRTVCWCAGWLLFIWATSGSPGVYGRVLFSMHMVQHMTIATAVPVLLVLGTPITLALRTTRRRTDGSIGPREWLLRIVRSLPVQILGHPLVAGGSFIISMAVFYYGPAFETSLASHTAHVVMVVHFLISGYLFAEVVVGEDPGVDRPIYPLRALLIMVVFGFHALFAVSLMAQTTVLAETWFSGLRRTWGASLADDQYTGASIGWLLGEYPLALMAVVLLISWVRADSREGRRFDRDEARTGDQALEAYNAALQRLGERSMSAGRGQATSGRARVDEKES